MNKYLSAAAVGALSFAFVTEAAATEWNVSVWGKRRAFTEHVEKLAELVSEKTGGEFTMNVSYGGLSKNPLTIRCVGQLLRNSSVQYPFMCSPPKHSSKPTKTEIQGKDGKIAKQEMKCMTLRGGGTAGMEKWGQKYFFFFYIFS